MKACLSFYAFIVTPEEKLKINKMTIQLRMSRFSALSMNQPESSRRRRVATAADNAAKPIPKSTSVTGSALLLRCGNDSG